MVKLRFTNILQYINLSVKIFIDATIAKKYFTTEISCKVYGNAWQEIVWLALACSVFNYFIVGIVQLAPACWVMPHQHEEFVNTAAKHEMTFFVKPLSSGSEWRSRVVNLEKPGDIKYMENRRFYLCGFQYLRHIHNTIDFTNKAVLFSDTIATNFSSLTNHLVYGYLSWSPPYLHWEPTCTRKGLYISGLINIRVTIEYVFKMYLLIWMHLV